VSRGFSSCTARAPASVGNVAVGFDILGHSFDALYDTVRATRVEANRVEVSCSGPGSAGLPLAAARNTAGRSAQAVLERAGVSWGVTIDLGKGIPLAAGMGGSGASAVAAALAVNGLLERGLPTELLLDCALEGEAAATGSRVIDNVAASLLGGLVFAVDGQPPLARAIPTPSELFCVVVHPDLVITTQASRAGLSTRLESKLVVNQMANLAGVVLGCCQADMGLLGRFLRDGMIEPQRASAVPGFYRVQASAMLGGALGCSLSGSGPSMFAWCKGEEQALEVALAMVQEFGMLDIDTEHWVAPVNAPGAQIVERL
jgi:homoserine kinase